MGLCTDPMNGTDTYFFGDWYDFDNFSCGDAMELVGDTHIQCVLGNTPNESKWSGAFPQCQLKVTGMSTIICKAFLK